MALEARYKLDMEQLLKNHMVTAFLALLQDKECWMEPLELIRQNL